MLREFTYGWTTGDLFGTEGVREGTFSGHWNVYKTLSFGAVNNACFINGGKGMSVTFGYRHRTRVWGSGLAGNTRYVFGATEGWIYGCRCVKGLSEEYGEIGKVDLDGSRGKGMAREHGTASCAAGGL